jgi:hypothetical protein
MENNNFFNFPLNPLSKNLSPFKEDRIYQSNGYINKDNLTNIQNTPFKNNPLSCFVTPKKDYRSLDPEVILSPLVSNNKAEIMNNNLLSLHKNSINDLSPFRPMNNSPYTNSKIFDKM